MEVIGIQQTQMLCYSKVTSTSSPFDWQDVLDDDDQ